MSLKPTLEEIKLIHPWFILAWFPVEEVRNRILHTCLSPKISLPKISLYCDLYSDVANSWEPVKSTEK